MANLLHYKGYVGSVKFIEDKEFFYGKLEFINDLITFQGTSVNPHFSQEIYCDAKSTHACCVALPQTPRRTYSTPASASVVRLASTGIFDISLRSLVRNAG